MSEDMSVVEKNELVALTAEIVSAFVANNSVAPDRIPDVIQAVHQALAGLGGEPHVEPEALVPAVPIKKSVTPDALICLEGSVPGRGVICSPAGC
jgi:predicted transcriptional regulator